MDLEGARAAKGNEKTIFFHIKSELARLVEKRVMTPGGGRTGGYADGCALSDRSSGQRMLAASVVRREWSFNLHVEDRFPRCFRA